VALLTILVLPTISHNFRKFQQTWLNFRWRDMAILIQIQKLKRSADYIARRSRNHGRAIRRLHRFS